MKCIKNVDYVAIRDIIYQGHLASRITSGLNISFNISLLLAPSNLIIGMNQTNEIRGGPVVQLSTCNGLGDSYGRHMM